MPVIDVVYNGETYHVNDRALDELKEEIGRSVSAGGGWLEVIDGGGPAHLLVASGTSIALIPQRFCDA